MFKDLEEAYKAFLGPPKSPRNKREQDLWDSGDPFQIQVEDRKVYGRTYGAGKPVLLMHGWAGRGTQYRAYIEPLIERGYQVILADAPGHGDSDGDWATMFYFGRTMKQISLQWDLHAVVGHSIAATAAPWSVLQGAKIPNLVMISPTCKVGTLFDKFVERTSINEDLAAQVARRWNDEYGAETLVQASVDYTIRNSPMHGLIVHDTDDTEASVEDAYAIHQLWPDSELFVTNGLGHVLILRSEKVVERICDWLDAR